MFLGLIRLRFDVRGYANGEGDPKYWGKMFAGIGVFERVDRPPLDGASGARKGALGGTGKAVPVW